MDENSYLVLIKGADKTAQVKAIDVRKPHVWVTFHSSTKRYSYAETDVVFSGNPVITDITEGKLAYQDGMPLRDVVRVCVFDTKVRIAFANGKSAVFDAESIRVEANDGASPSARTILQHWTDISQYTSIAAEGTNGATFLKKQFDKLTFVSPNSVLGYYLNGRTPGESNRTVHDSVFPFRFNLSQKTALDHALRNRISVIEGPPGTGKTQTILNILANLVMQNKSVAVVSGNNAAVQNVKDKLELKGYHFLVAALGNKENKQRFFANPPQGDMSTWKSDIDTREYTERIRKLNTTIDHLMEIEREVAKLHQKLSAYRLEREHFETYYANQGVSEARRPSLCRLTPDRIISILRSLHRTGGDGTTERFLHKVRLFLLYGFIDFRRLEHQRIDVILNLERKYYQLKIRQIEHKIARLQEELRQNSYDGLLNEHQQISESLFRQKLHQKYHGLGPLGATERSYKRDFAIFIKRYPIMLSTTYSLRNSIPENFLFDYVIIDESSQVDLLSGALALSSSKNAIIVGDTKQLPQIVDTTISEKVSQGVQAGGPYDYFSQNLLSSMLALYGEAIPKVMLREHYRCHPRIIEFCNQKYYGGDLIAYTQEREDDSPLMIYRTAPGNHMREVTHGKTGKFNQRELDVIQREVLVNLAAAAKNHPDTGFTTPYRKQVEKALRQMDEDIEIDTIHKYQGREKRTMILSTVLDSSRSGRMGLQFVNDPCMINVAVSRAQDRFILVTDHSLFRDYGSEIGDLIQYMEYNTMDDNVVESQIVSVFDLLYQDYSERLKPFAARVQHRSKYASENIMWTLLDEILRDEQYQGLECRGQVWIRNLLNDVNRLNDEERGYVNRGASVDFVIYHKWNKCPILVIEVDGFAFHENKIGQLQRDRMKDHILETYGLPLVRVPVTGSGEEYRIRTALGEVLQNERV